MAAQTFKRARAIAAIARIAAEAKAQEKNANDWIATAAKVKDKPDLYETYRQLAEIEVARMRTTRAIVADLLHTFGIDEEELS